MSQSHIDIIIDRIGAATPESPIAVFLDIQKSEGKTRKDLNAVFAETIHTQSRITKKDPYLIGVYHKADNTPELKKHLKEVLREVA